jgi:hypothetical protein
VLSILMKDQAKFIIATQPQASGVKQCDSRGTEHPQTSDAIHILFFSFETRAVICIQLNNLRRLVIQCTHI